VAHRPAQAGRPRFDIGDIVRQHRAALETQMCLTLQQRRVLSAMALCRTAELGGHVDVCCSCGYEHPAYNSCRNRHCPKCQALAQEKWIAARSQRLLPVKHFHVVFTLPSQLRSLALSHSREMYKALLAAASATLLELGRTRLGARLGITMVLHTWTRDLRYHPHVHAIVTAGGLSDTDSQWIPSSPKYLFPVKVMGALFRGKMMAALRSLYSAGAFEAVYSLAEPAAFERLMATLASKSWVVYAKKPFREAKHVMAYLGRYTHRVAIANSRLVDVSDHAVTFRTKNGKTVTLSPVDFLRRFIAHILPDGLHKIRHYGLYCSAHARPGGLLETAQQYLEPDLSTPDPDERAPNGWVEQLQVFTGRDVARCPVCGGRLYSHVVPSPLIGSKSRPPPLPRRLNP
jgi:hypothetical protein